ncbi:hypothetical protein Gorai_022071, partial [Gossypium raimondii]|nr:hypothetical protein [Gossypium raimondii]
MACNSKEMDTVTVNVRIKILFARIKIHVAYLTSVSNTYLDMGIGLWPSKLVGLEGARSIMEVVGMSHRMGVHTLLVWITETLNASVLQGLKVTVSKVVK